MVEQTCHYFSPKIRDKDSPLEAEIIKVEFRPYSHFDEDKLVIGDPTLDLTLRYQQRSSRIEAHFLVPGSQGNLFSFVQAMRLVHGEDIRIGEDLVGKTLTAYVRESKLVGIAIWETIEEKEVTETSGPLIYIETSSN